MTSDSKLKVAVIGLGRWGQVLLKEFKLQSEVKYECDSKTDLGPVLADPEVSVVVIATPTETHFDIAMRALKAGKNVFLEKPGSTNSRNLAQLVEFAKSTNLKLAIGYEFPHHPAAQKLKELIASQNIKGIYLEWQKWGTFKDNAVMHLFCHEVSILKFLGIKDFTPLSHKKTAVISETDIIETEFKNIKSTINRVSPIKQKAATVILENGSYVWSNNELFFINKDARALEKMSMPAITPVAAEINDFLNAVKENREPMINGQFALEVFKIIERL